MSLFDIATRIQKSINSTKKTRSTNTYDFSSYADLMDSETITVQVVNREKRTIDFTAFTIEPIQSFDYIICNIPYRGTKYKVKHVDYKTTTTGYFFNKGQAELVGFNED